MAGPSSREYTSFRSIALPIALPIALLIVTSFHKTGDARVILEKLELKEVHGFKLDIQVPERFRHDLTDRDVLRRRSSNKHTTVSVSIPVGQVPLAPRSSFSRNNSIRKLRTNSLGHSDASGRRNSIFSPQDARSDLMPGLPDLPEDEVKEGSNLTPSELRFVPFDGIYWKFLR